MFRHILRKLKFSDPSPSGTNHAETQGKEIENRRKEENLEKRRNSKGVRRPTKENFVFIKNIKRIHKDLFSKSRKEIYYERSISLCFLCIFKFSSEFSNFQKNLYVNFYALSRFESLRTRKKR